MEIKSAGLAALSISCWLVLSLPIVISDMHTKDPAHYIQWRKKSQVSKCGL